MMKARKFDKDFRVLLGMGKYVGKRASFSDVDQKKNICYKYRCF